MANILLLAGGGAPQGGVNGRAKLLYEVTGSRRASPGSFGNRRGLISPTGSRALLSECNLSPIRLSQRPAWRRELDRSLPIHAISSAKLPGARGTLPPALPGARPAKAPLSLRRVPAGSGAPETVRPARRALRREGHSGYGSLRTAEDGGRSFDIGDGETDAGDRRKAP